MKAPSRYDQAPSRYDHSTIFPPFFEPKTTFFTKSFWDANRRNCRLGTTL